MLTRDVEIRVRYYETDKMGVVHHSNFLRYYETARTEAVRELGMPYSRMEKEGVMLPVLEVHSEYISPAYDDDLLTVRVMLKKLPLVKMRFDYEIFRAEGELINTGYVVLAFVDGQTRKPCRTPRYFLDVIEPWFK